MRKLQSILFATDFQAASRDAVPVVMQLADLFDSRITLLHVIGSSDMWPDLVHHYRETKAGEMHDLAQRFAQHDILVDETVINVGNPADAIVRKAEEIDADLVLIGAGEQSPFGHVFLGPVASAVMQHASRPVLAVRPGEPAVTFRKILCPVDMSETSARGLANATQLARAFGSQLIVLSVVPSHSWPPTLAESGHLSEAIAAYQRNWRVEFDQFLTMCAIADVEWRKEVRIGVPHEEIAASAKEHQADLIVMGSTGRTGLARILMGSVTRRIIQRLPCSLLTTKQQNVLEELHDDELQTVKVLYAQGKALLAARSYDAALDKFSHVLIRNPFHAAALTGKAAALDALGHHADADRCRRRAAVIEKSEEPEYELGVVD
jgi:nucleotide-binding universal stress UspA family protein